MTEVYKPGDKVVKSGIYRVVHDPKHPIQQHDVTCVAGHIFPPCRGCGQHPRFVLRDAAQHIDLNEHFKK
jgi:hypothetical protein